MSLDASVTCARGAVFALLVASSACMVGHRHALPPGAGSVTFRWSIDERFDPSECFAHRSAWMQVDVYASSGPYVTSATPTCAALRVTLVLREGVYTGELTLQDVTDRAVSTTLSVQPFLVVDGIDTFIDTDFPSSSFY